MTAPPPARLWPLALLAALVALGLAAHALGLVDARVALAWARIHAAQWWFPAALVALQVLLFTFGLPGSAVLWLAAPLYAPPAATAILTAGGCLGALAAHGFASGLTGASQQRLQASPGYRILQRESDFLVLCALRLAPGFPHSVINYAAGMLRVRRAPFIASAAIGFGVKSWLYATVIHGALAAGRPADLLAPAALWPLVALVAVVLLARVLLRRRTLR
jgi:uncharacterized membrane protein YdjX (TVP38/TMEM64 family)